MGRRQVKIPEKTRKRLAVCDYKRAAKQLGCTVEEAKALRLELGIKARGGKHKRRIRAPLNNRAKSAVEARRSGDGLEVASDGETIKTLPQLLAAAEVSDEWDVTTWRANTWTMGERRHWQVKATLARRPAWLDSIRESPEFPVPSPPPPGSKVVAFGDAHFGFVGAEPTHDEAALGAALALVRAEKPDAVVLLGDMLDLAAWSGKFEKPQAVRYQTKAALEALQAWLVELREAHAGAIYYIEGNHEQRIARAIRDRLPEAEGLITLPGLLGLDRLAIDYRGEYPRGDVWLDGVRYHHGEVVRAGVAEVLARADSHSQVFGHVHRVLFAAHTSHGEDGRSTTWAACPGCLARLDGTVPAASGRVDWQHGAVVVTGGRAEVRLF